jgi:branched-chain amino acid transport system substrate-binding protein
MVANDVRQGAVIGTYLVKNLRSSEVAIGDDRTAYGQGLADEVEKARGNTELTKQLTGWRY